MQSGVGSGRQDAGHITVQVQWMRRAELDQVLRIERASFGSPWSEEDFLCCLRQRNVIGMSAVASEGPREWVVGYVIYELRQKRLDILNLAVDDLCRRQGIGAQIVQRLIGKLTSHRRDEIDWWHLNSVSGPACTHHAGCRQKGVSNERR